MKVKNNICHDDARAIVLQVSAVSIYTEFDCNQWPNIIELNGGGAIVDKPQVIAPEYENMTW